MIKTTLKFAWIILPVFIVACSSSKAQEVPEKISNKKLVSLKARDDVQILDVRTPEETSYGIIEGAVTIDFYDPEFADKVKELDPERPVVIYCAAGGRSGKAVERLSNAGFEEIYDLTGGFRLWKAEGYPVVKESK